MTHNDTTLQAAIDAAFQTNGEKYDGYLVTLSDHYAWSREDSARLAVAKAFLAALQPAEQSAEIEKLKAELTQTKKHLIDANRGAQRNAYINQSLATKLNEALKRAEKAEADSVPAEAATFEAHGKTWTRHTPGDPMPVDTATFIDVLMDDGSVCSNQYVKFASTWNSITGWRYADEPEPEPEPAVEAEADPYAELKAAHAAGKVIECKQVRGDWAIIKYPAWIAPVKDYRIKPEPASEPAQPWTPAVGDVVRLKSGGLDMTVKALTADGLTSCIWFDPNGQYHQLPVPVASLELVRKEKP